MAYEVVRAEGVSLDLELIFDFLVAAAEDFGDDPETALRRAEGRLREIETGMERLGTAPHQGTLRPHLGAGIRNVIRDRAIYYFDIDEPNHRLRVLAVFFGGQDHDARILLRLLSPP